MSDTAAFRAMQIGRAALIALGFMILLEAAWVFVLPHDEHFAPEIGPAASFVVFAFLFSAQFLVGFGVGILALWVCSYMVRSFVPHWRRVALCVAFVSVALATSAFVAQGFYSGDADIGFLVMLFLLPFVLASAMLTKAQSVQ